MDKKNIIMWLLIVGGLVHLLMGVGQLALIAPVSPYLGIIQIVIGAVAVYALAEKLKIIK